MELFFQIMLVLYCVGALAFLARPLLAVSFFLFFRSNFSVAAYLQTPSFAGLPFFIPSLLVLAAQTAGGLLTSTVKFRINYAFAPYLCFLAIVLASGLVHVLMGSSIMNFMTEFTRFTFSLMAYILVYVGLKQEDDLEKIMRYLALASLIPMFTGLAEFALNIGLAYDTMTFISGLRPSGTIIDPNLYGIYLSLSLFLALPSILKEKRSKAAIFYVLFVILMIVVARNRGTWIALFMSFMFAVPLFSFRLSLKKWVGTAIILGILAAPIMLSRFAELNEYDQWGQKQDTAMGRYEYSVALFQHAISSPIIGHGTGGYDIGHYRTFGVPLEPHNDFMLIATQYGFPAMFTYMLFFALQLLWAIKHRRSRFWAYQFAAVLCQIYLIVISMVQNVINDNTAYMLMFSIMAIAHRASAMAGEDKVPKEITGTKNRSPRWVEADKEPPPVLGGKYAKMLLIGSKTTKEK